MVNALKGGNGRQVEVCQKATQKTEQTPASLGLQIKSTLQTPSRSKTIALWYLETPIFPLLILLWYVFFSVPSLGPSYWPLPSAWSDQSSMSTQDKLPPFLLLINILSRRPFLMLIKTSTTSLLLLPNFLIYSIVKILIKSLYTK